MKPVTYIIVSRGYRKISDSRAGDPATGEFEDAVLLRRFGKVASVEELLGADRVAVKYILMFLRTSFALDRGYGNGLVQTLG